MDPTAHKLHTDPSYPAHLLGVSAPQSLHPESRIPQPFQDIILTSLRRPLPEGFASAMNRAVSDPVSITAFKAAIRCQPSGKAPGPSGLTANMIKAWPESTIKMAHSLIQTLWHRGSIPGWWGDRLLCLAPKSSDDFTLDNLRPISLFEVLRKIWLGIISHRITAVWDSHNILHDSQHGFRSSRHGTETALVQLISDFESADEGEELYLTSWDIQRAFDSIARYLKELAWARMGLTGDPLRLNYVAGFSGESVRMDSIHDAESYHSEYSPCKTCGSSSKTNPTEFQAPTRNRAG